MEEDHSVNSIPDINNFKYRLRTNVYKTYFTFFSSDVEFQNSFDENYLTKEVLDFWIEYYTFKGDNGIVSIYSLDYDRLEMTLYKEFVEAILLSLVDRGILEMCWDKERMRVIWKRSSTEINHEFE